MTKDFYPEHYRRLLSLLVGQYLHQKASEATGSFRLSVINLLDCYLDLMINDCFHRESLIFDNRSKSLDKTGTSSSRIHLKSIIQQFYLDFILIYTAMLLKKRMVIYHHDRAALLAVVSALPDLLPHRPEIRHCSLLPNIDLDDLNQLNDLRRRREFIATTIDDQSKITQFESLFDLFINLAAIEITISHSSKEVFAMTKTHKDIAIALVRVATKPESNDSDVVREISKKTEELLTILHTKFIDSSTNKFIDDGSAVQLDEKLASSVNLRQFFRNLAIAEGFEVDASSSQKLFQKKTMDLFYNDQ